MVLSVEVSGLKKLNKEVYYVAPEELNVLAERDALLWALALQQIQVAY